MERSAMARVISAAGFSPTVARSSALLLYLAAGFLAGACQSSKGTEYADPDARNPGPFETFVAEGGFPVVSRQGWIYFGRMPPPGGTGSDDPNRDNAANDELLTLWTCRLDGTEQQKVRLDMPSEFFWVPGSIWFVNDPSVCYLSYLPYRYRLDPNYWDRFAEFTLQQPDKLQTKVAQVQAAGETGEAFISPDQRLGFHYLVGPTDRWELCRLNAAGDSDGHIWGPIPLYAGDWSPDSSRFAFVPRTHRDFDPGVAGFPITNSRTVYIFDLQRHSITEAYTLPNTVVKRVSWSPDGKWFAIWGNVQGEHPHWALTLLELSSSRVWQFKRCDSQPSWTPDSQWLFYSRSPGGDEAERIFRFDWRKAIESVPSNTQAEHSHSGDSQRIK